MYSFLFHLSRLGQDGWCLARGRAEKFTVKPVLPSWCADLWGTGVRRPQQSHWWGCMFKVKPDDGSTCGNIHLFHMVWKDAWNVFCLSEFLVSELQAAQIIRHKESHPEEKPTEAESEKGQRIENQSHELPELCQEHQDNDDIGKAEMQAEWILLLHALNMDTSSGVTDVLREVRLRKRKNEPCISLRNWGSLWKVCKGWF